MVKVKWTHATGFIFSLPFPSPPLFPSRRKFLSSPSSFFSFFLPTCVGKKDGEELLYVPLLFLYFLFLLFFFFFFPPPPCHLVSSTVFDIRFEDGEKRWMMIEGG